MTPYESSGSYTSESREVDVSETWDAWDNPQVSGNVEVVGGTLQLAEMSVPDSELLHARYAADELSLSDGDPITSWPDETDNNFDLSGGSPTYNASGGPNDMPYADFDGTDDTLGTTSGTISQPHAGWLVVSFPSLMDRQFVFTSNDGATNSYFDVRGEADEYRISADGSVVGGTFTAGQFAIFGGVFDGSNSEIRANGSVVATGDVGSTAWEGYAMGDLNEDFGSLFAGRICEALSYDGIPNKSEVEQYLSSKYGFSI